MRPAYLYLLILLFRGFVGIERLFELLILKLLINSISYRLQRNWSDCLFFHTRKQTPSMSPVMPPPCPTTKNKSLTAFDSDYT